MRFTEQGWLGLTVLDNDLDEAKRTAAAQTAEAIDAGVGTRFDAETSYIGVLGEKLFDGVLAEEEISHVHHGGFDGKPDFELPPLGGADLKTRRTDGRFEPHYEVPFVASQFAKPVAPYLIFAAYREGSPPSLLIIGAISAERYFTEARFIPAGMPLAGSGHETPVDVFQLRADRLKPIKQTLEYLRKGTE